MNGPCAGHDNIDPNGVEYRTMKEHEPDEKVGHLFLKRFPIFDDEPVLAYRCRHCGCVYIPEEE